MRGCPPRDTCPHSALPATAGFTLLELLVVVFIVGIIATMFTLSVGVTAGSDREMRREADRLAALLSLALEDATFQSRELGLRLYPRRYEFSVFDRGDPADPEDDAWVPLKDDVFASRELPDLFGYDLDIEGRTVDLERSEQDVKKRYQPQVFIFSSGDFSDAFVVRLQDREAERGYSVEAAIDGSVKVSRDED